MRRCRDDHEREFYFHGFFQKKGRPVVIVEDVESHKLTELAVTDVTFTSRPPLGPEDGVATMMPPAEMFGAGVLRRNNPMGLAETMRDVYNEHGGVLGTGPVGQQVQRPTQERPTVAGEFDGMMEEAMPAGGEAEPMGRPEMEEQVPELAAHRRDVAETQGGVHGGALQNAPLNGNPNTAQVDGTGVIRQRPREDDNQMETPVEELGEAEADVQ